VILIDPAGRALPCHAAGCIPGLEFDNVREKTLRWIWEESPAFNKFRGEAWLSEPCRSCERRTRTSADAAARHCSHRRRKRDRSGLHAFNRSTDW